ncbi:hypothetical protein JD844_000766 [Phrynosoma platyrhinos]|uniref:RNA methyltransferase n=1 Tax=Phrynosoma platyrhinos TaxID=52577 RepID=A0ABQ7T8J7_PHRPL|nr:hypothetical protein JD844_000766 [Phrynosoma platyrhinos]
MIEMATDKEAFRVPAPPPPLLKPPNKGAAGGGAGDVPLAGQQEQQPGQGAERGDGGGGGSQGPGEVAQAGGQGLGATTPPAAPPNRDPHPPRRGGPLPKEEHRSTEEGDSVAELQRPRNGFQAPHQRPPGSGGGKRRNSCNVGGGGFKHPAFKRRRRINSDCDPVLPSEFLLGGNIFDPLNLNSLLDEEVNQALNAETPKSSPLPAKGRDPVEILIPKDITDPLSLNNAQDDAPILASPIKSGRKRHRHRGAQRGASVEGGAAKPPVSSSSSSITTAAATSSCRSCQKPCNGATPQPYELNTAINCRDEVITPLLPAGQGEPQQSHPQALGGSVTPSCTSMACSTASTGNRHHRKRRRTSSKSEGAGARHPGAASAPSDQPCRSSPERGHSVPRCRHPQAASSHQQQPRRQPRHKFQYGNYCKYYGYRNPDCEDVRLRVMKPEWFQGKEVLDVGCNVGHLTLSVAKKWGPSRMVGLDIDGALIHSARQNIRHYLSEEMQQQKRQSDEGGASATRKTFPASLMASRGPIAAPRGNYVLEHDELLEAQKPEYDVILCLSLTKWVHLNWGDEGLKRLFKRIYRHLRPGGILILEPQAWSSYKKRKNLTVRIAIATCPSLSLWLAELLCCSCAGLSLGYEEEALTQLTVYRHFHRIKLKPDQFASYLTSSEVGFSSYELVAMPRNTAKDRWDNTHEMQRSLVMLPVRA